MRLLIYPFYLFWKIISSNPVKSIMLITALILFYCAYYTSVYDDKIVKTEIVGSIKIANTYYYLYHGDKEQFKSIKSNKPLIFKDNIYAHKEPTNPFCILIFIAWLLITILIFFLIVSIFEDSDDISWEIEDCFESAFDILISCEIEDGYYHYIALGRLVGKTKEMSRYFEANSFATLLNCPKFKTKTQRRNEVLKKLV